MQILYNVNQTLDLESWDGNFHAILLHGSMEHLASNAKNIKESLCHMQKHILNKVIDGDKANDIKNLEGIGEVAWGFISTLYKSYWNNFIADKNNFFFRHKVKAQFNPQINRDNSSKKGKEADKPASVSNIPPLIPAKSSREVIKISKFSKKNIDNKGKILYAQASSSSSNAARKTLKIKEMFLNLQNKKIENIQNIISSEIKSKLKLNMTMKGPLRKQVVVPMNAANIRNLMKDLSSHVFNINRALKNIKLEVIADFIHLENRGVVITTNKVADTLDLQMIERYVKNINNIEVN